MARTLFEKIWDRHVIAQGSGGDALLWIDRHYIHEGSFHAFNALAAAGREVRRPREPDPTVDSDVDAEAGAVPAVEPRPVEPRTVSANVVQEAPKKA